MTQADFLKIWFADINLNPLQYFLFLKAIIIIF